MRKLACVLTVLALAVSFCACADAKPQDVSSNLNSSQLADTESQDIFSSSISKTESETVSKLQGSSSAASTSQQLAVTPPVQKPVSSSKPAVVVVPKPIDVKAENKKKTQEILSKITNQNMTDVEKIKASYKWLYPNFRYRTDKIDLSHGFTEQLETQLVSYYFKRRKGSCEHYAAVQKAFINELGYECMYVSGERFSSNTYKWGEHVWLLVKVNDNWYHVDGLYGGLFYDVTETTFMVPDSKIASTHRWDRTKYPACTSEQLLK